MKNERLRVPKLRFKEFSGEWAEKYFGDIYSFLQTNSFSRALLNYEDGDVKNIHYGDIHTKFKSNFYIQDEIIPYINQDIDLSKIKEENYCKEKDLVIADASEDYKDIGKAIELIDLNNEKLLAGLHTYIARDDKDKMALGFSGYFMQTHNVRVQMMKMATGISVLGISKGNLNKLELTIPKKQEQEKIASFLSSIDKKINQLSKKDELLQNYKKAMMQKIFSQKLRFKKENGSDYSKWEVLELNNILEVIDGDRGFNYPKITDFFENEYCLFLNAKNVTKSGFNFNDCLFITKEKDDLLSKGKLNKFDIVLTTRGSVGNFAYFDDSIPFDNIRINSGMVILRKKNQKVSQNYIYKLFGSMFIKNQIEKIAFGSAQPQLTVKEIKRFKINLPSLEEQTKIANFLSALDTKISQNKKALEETQKFKKALLEKMFV